MALQQYRASTVLANCWSKVTDRWRRVTTVTFTAAAVTVVNRGGKKLFFERKFF